MKIRPKFQFKLHHFTYLAIFFIALTLRVYKLRERFPFTMDEEYQAFLVKNILTTGHIPLIGVNVADTGLYLGPLFTWFSTIPYYLANLHPIGTAWAAAIIGSLTAVIVAWVTFQISTSLVRKTKLTLLSATLAGILYAINPLINFYDRKYWNPSTVPMLTVLWYLAISKYTKNSRWLLLITVIFGLAFHTHYALFILLPATAWIIIQTETSQPQNLPNRMLSFFKNLKLPFIKLPFLKSQLPIPAFLRPQTARHQLFQNHRLIALIIISVFISPLVIFELRHDFIQTNSLLNHFLNSAQPEFTQPLMAKFQIFTNSISRLFWIGFNLDLAKEITLCSQLVKTTSVLPLALIFPVSLYILWSSKHYSRQVTANLIILVTYLFSFIFYPGQISEYYFLPLFPIILINLALLFNQKQSPSLSHQITSVGSVFILVILMLTWVSQSITFKNHLGLANKERLIEYAKTVVGDHPYHLNSLGTCFKYEGYRYLTEVHHFQPESSYLDPQLSWLYSDQVQPNDDMEVIFASSNDTDLSTWLTEKNNYAYLKTTASYNGLNVLVRKID